MPTPPHRSFVRRRFPAAGLAAFLALGACQQQAPSAAPARSAGTGSQTRIARNLGAELSEDAETDRALERSLTRFLDQCDAGAFERDTVKPEHAAQHSFFFNELIETRASQRSGFHIDPAVVLKSYSFDGDSYYISLAFHGERDGERFLRKIVQVKAVPHDPSSVDGATRSYRFECLFEERTLGLQTTKVDNVTYRHARPLDNNLTQQFADFRQGLCQRTNAPCPDLTYYAFTSLETLLRAYGIEYDRNKCNFLAKDLGFGEANGARFVTGMGSECNIRDYVYAHFRHALPNAGQLYPAMLEGLAVCYGNTWGGVTLDQMKTKFGRAQRQDPSWDFLTEHLAARKSHVGPHYTHFFVCALFCEKLLAEGRFEDALAMLYSGKNGGRFFTELKAALDVDREDFHTTVVSML
ncbi:MAG: hypothetical protein AB8H80_16200 [Planctomycetota bacterium]